MNDLIKPNQRVCCTIIERAIRKVKMLIWRNRINRARKLLDKIICDRMSTCDHNEH
jgi:hypothetical protein